MVRHVGRLLDGHRGSIPFEHVTDGDRLLLMARMLHLGGLDTVRITKVKGHADQGMVLDGRVREIDRLGNNAADEAADFGRRRVGNAVIDARRDLSGVCGRWYPGALPKRRRLVHAVRDRAFLPPLPATWESEWVRVPASAIGADDIAQWPYTTGLLVKWVVFIGYPALACWWFGLLGLVVSHMLNCSFFMSFGLVRGCLWRSSVWSRH